MAKKKPYDLEAAFIPIDTPITLVNSGWVVHTKVVKSYPDFFHVLGDGEPSTPYWDDGEGVTWLRGHHALESDTVKAAIVARRLKEDDVTKHAVTAGMGLSRSQIGAFMGGLVGAIAADAIVEMITGKKK